MHDLAHEVAVAVVLRLNPRGRLYLVVDDTLLHKRGKHVYGLGWFRDAVASTAKRVVTASGNHWVVVGLAIRIPMTQKIYCLPIHAKLHLSGKNRESEATLAGTEFTASEPRSRIGTSRVNVVPLSGSASTRSRPDAPRSSSASTHHSN